MFRLMVFCRGEGNDNEGRSLEQILAWNDDDLEAVHDFIQWLFPLPEPSQYNPNAPLLTKADVAAFKCDPVLQANLMRSFERILTFLGLSLSVNGDVMQGRFQVAGCGHVGHAQSPLAAHHSNPAELEVVRHEGPGQCSFRPPGGHVHDQEVSNLGRYVQVLDRAVKE